jgi:5-methylcytosine-specific restriction protein A
MGLRGKGFIEAHHTKPVETLVESSKTKLEDLALLCANCHRMVHAARPWLSIEALQKLLKQQTRGTVTP